MKEVFLYRMRIVLALFLILSATMLTRLFFIQIVNGEAYAEQADRQYTTPMGSSFDRGSVFFERKDGEPFGAAVLQSGFLLAIAPDQIKDPVSTYDALYEILPELEKETFFLRAGKKGDPYEEIANRLMPDTAEKIRELDLQGVYLHREKWRWYPLGTLAAHLVGFVGYQKEELNGRYGVERYYDYVLKRDEKDLYVNFFAEVFANVGRSLFYHDAEREGDIILTVEPEVQRTVESILEHVAKELSAESGGALVINPKDGSVYAMAVYPSFDPNFFSNVEDYSVFSNPFVESVFEMGSIIKALTMAAGIDAGAVRRTDTYVDHGSLQIDGKRIENYDGKARGEVSMQEVLNQSLNTGAVHTMREMGKETFSEYLLAFGLGEETGIDLPNEIPGLVGNLESSREIEYATASFGQGVASTPIATVRALSALANKGVLVTPHVVDRIEYPFAPLRRISYGDDGRVLKEATAEEITRMLVEVVDEALAGGTAALPRYSIAAKTGTAQIADPEGGGYYKDRFLHSFFGYFPAHDAKFLVFFYIVDPHGVRYASETLTDPFMDTVQFLINYYNIPPDR